MKSTFRADAIPSTARTDFGHAERISRQLRSSMGSIVSLYRDGKINVPNREPRQHYPAFIVRNRVKSN